MWKSTHRPICTEGGVSSSVLLRNIRWCILELFWVKEKRMRAHSDERWRDERGRDEHWCVVASLFVFVATH